jgi:hypothetical protein
MLNPKQYRMYKFQIPMYRDKIVDLALIVVLDFGNSNLDFASSSRRASPVAAGRYSDL